MTSTEAHINLCNSLMAAEKVWEATVDALTDAVYIFGADKRLKKINRAGESLERASRSFLVGRGCCDMLWGLGAASCMVDRAISNSAEVDVELDSSNKARRPLQVRVIPQKTEATGGCIVNSPDVFEMRKGEEGGNKERAVLGG